MAKEILDKIHTNPEIRSKKSLHIGITLDAFIPRLFSKLKIYMGAFFPSLFPVCLGWKRSLGGRYGNIETKYKEIVVESIEENVKYE